MPAAATIHPHDKASICCLLRHVRDTGANDHTATRLLRFFGRSLTVRALGYGLIKRQEWQGGLTDWIDLTPEGEALLVSETKART